MWDAQKIEMQWGVKIPLRDGVRLSATVYLPKERARPVPCVFSLTPYIADTFHERGVYFAARGIPFVIVDVRGRGNSEGTFRPMIQESNDGYDIVEWLARQPYCNGKVSMWGGSYGGYVQWATAKQRPRALATIVPVAAPWSGVDFPMRNNIFNPYVVQWLTYTAGRASQGQIFHDRRFWSASYRAWHESGRPFRDVDRILGQPSTAFQEWLDHPYLDDYWDQYNPTPEDYARLDIPVLSITGSYDDDQPGALEHYRQHLKYASPEARARHYLVIGPWDHAGTRTPQLSFGGMTFGKQSLVDLPRLHTEWYAWTMQDAPKPEFLRNLVAYYVMGAEKWRYAESLREVTAGYQSLFLDSTSGANDVFWSGSLSSENGKGAPDSYVWDPRDVSGPEIEAEANADGASIVDQTVTFALTGKQLVYHSDPFEADTEISGFFKLSAWIALDCPDADIYASVHEICQDGTSIRLATDAIRARYREGLRTPKLIDTKEPLRYDFERFTFVSRQIKKGHRLRLVIAPMGRLIETTFAEKNYNTGGVIANESAETARAVTVTLFHDAAHPSALYVPLGRPETPSEPDAPANYLLQG